MKLKTLIKNSVILEYTSSEIVSAHKDIEKCLELLRPHLNILSGYFKDNRKPELLKSLLLVLKQLRAISKGIK